MGVIVIGTPHTKEQVLIHTADIDSAHADRIATQGLVIVNAPRPIYGTITWTGQYRHGTFYAAGTRAEYGAHWDQDDAWDVITLSNAASITAVKAYLLGRGGDYWECASAFSDKDLAGMYRMPWKD